jgi:hypothetical protein
VWAACRGDWREKGPVFEGGVGQQLYAAGDWAGDIDDIVFHFTQAGADADDGAAEPPAHALVPCGDAGGDADKEVVSVGADRNAVVGDDDFICAAEGVVAIGVEPAGEVGCGSGGVGDGDASGEKVARVGGGRSRHAIIACVGASGGVASGGGFGGDRGSEA